MKRAYILVEGLSDAAFLRRVLSQQVLRDVELVPAGGSAGIPSLARSLLVRRKTPIAVVMDSDSINPEVVEERQQSTEEFIRSANASLPVKVITAVPEIEAWFFARPETLEHILGGKVSADWLTLGKRDPKGVLRLLAEKNKKPWDLNDAINALTVDDIDRIRSIPEVAELNTFLQEVQKNDKAA